MLVLHLGTVAVGHPFLNRAWSLAEAAVGSSVSGISDLDPPPSVSCNLSLDTVRSAGHVLAGHCLAR